MGKQKELNTGLFKDLIFKRQWPLRNFARACICLHVASFQSKNTSVMVQKGAEKFFCCLSLETLSVTTDFNELEHA